MRSLPRLFIVIACGSLLSACEPPERAVLPLDQTDELVVITINSPDTYYENADGAYAGLEYDLASEFARERFGLDVRTADLFDADLPSGVQAVGVPERTPPGRSWCALSHQLRRSFGR